jgi:hypothetical protein
MAQVAGAYLKGIVVSAYCITFNPGLFPACSACANGAFNVRNTP